MDKHHPKLKFLVLIDFSKNAYKALKYAISLAKTVNANLGLLYVASPLDIDKSDNPTVVLRAMEVDKNKAELHLKSIIEMIETEGLKADYINTVGNVQSKMKEYFRLLSPNLIILGKSDYKKQRLGEVMEFLLDQNRDNVLIIGNDDEFSKNTSISIECNENSLTAYSSNLLFWLSINTKSTLRLYVNKRKRSDTEFSFPEKWNGIKNLKHKVCYKNNKHFSVASGLKKHLTEENIKLVCIGRKRVNTSLFSKLFNQPNSTKEIIKHTQIPVMVLGETM